MPATLTVPNVESLKPAFPGLESYQEHQAASFYGRDEEIEELTQLVKYSTFILLFGKSGTGKTSLLNAGVFPKLRDSDCLPFRIRLTFNETSAPLLEQVWDVLKTQIKTYGFKVQGYIPGETMWEFFHREGLWKIVTPVLVFDQFEEIFTLATTHRGKKEELELMIGELADVVENRVPLKVQERYLNEKKRIEYDYLRQRVKVIFSFREDFLAEMEGITSRIAAVKNVRYRLMPFNGTKAYEVITKTWNNVIDKNDAEEIITYLVPGGDDKKTYKSNLSREVMEIEPSLLSQVCASLDAKRLQENLDTISPDFLKRYPKEGILTSIYHDALKESTRNGLPGTADEKATTATERNAKRFIEDNLVNAKGFREKVAGKDIPPQIVPVVNGLKSRFFMRQDGVYIELTHDVIAAIIKKERDQRLKEEADKAFKRKAILFSAILVFVSFVAFALVTYRTIEAEAKTEAAEAKTKEANERREKVLKQIVRLEDRHRSLSRHLDSLMQADSNRNISRSAQNNRGLLDSLKNEIATLEKSREGIKYIDRVHTTRPLVIGKDTTQKSGNENQRLQDEIQRLKDEVSRMKNEGKNPKTLVVNPAYINAYQSHLDTLMMSKNLSLREIRERLNAMNTNWNYFLGKTNLRQIR